MAKHGNCSKTFLSIKIVAKIAEHQIKYAW